MESSELSGGGRRRWRCPNKGRVVGSGLREDG